MLGVALLIQTWVAGLGGSLHAARNDTVQGIFWPIWEHYVGHGVSTFRCCFIISGMLAGAQKRSVDLL